MKVQWTQEQKKVIGLRGRNILVSAAAGSGKTAVLVERILRMLVDPVSPVSVDRLLIVTYTEAAASEMKERIRQAIEELLKERPQDVNLQRQATLVHSAQITTIHRFCLSVIREHFHRIDLDPGFRVAEEGELKLLKQDVLEELLEECYAQGSQAFLELVEKTGGRFEDWRLKQLLLKIYEYSRSYPQPEKWLEGCALAYAPEACREEPAFLLRVREISKQYIRDFLEISQEALALCRDEDGPFMYEPMLAKDVQMLTELSEAESFQELYIRLQSLQWAALRGKKSSTVSPEKRERVKDLRDQVKKKIKELTKLYFYEEPKELLSDMESCYPVMKEFTELVKRFAEEFTEKKRSKNLIDFSDMEQYSLKILTEEKEGVLYPSAAAYEYQEQFEEVMIDEYQDSNLIQEAILTSVSCVSRGKNNIFMVGDVKQSIYRFRLSRPELFMEKYTTYSLTESDRQRVDLHKNFRSRTEVLDSVNFVFSQIMQKELGGIVYDTRAALYPGAEFESLKTQDGSSAYETELLLLDTKDLSEKKEQEETREDCFPEIQEEEAPGREQEEDTSDKTAKELEAHMVAQRICRLLKTGYVKDKTTGNLRKVEYRDIVILLRSVKGWADVFVSVLTKEGIPAYAAGGEGYFETYEVRVLMDYLKILDNQRQDIPLTAVLTSPFAGLSAQELAQIRLCRPGGSFYEAAQEYAGREGEEENLLSQKLAAFYRQLAHFREMVPYTAIHTLLFRILEETGYGLYVSAMPGGRQRKANVEMLVEKAVAFEGTSYKGLFNFVRYIGQLQKYQIDYSEAVVNDEQSDTVRILSIHKSKGLEYPVVFVSGLGNSFNTQDTKGMMIVHPQWGIGVDAADLTYRTKVPTILKKLIREETKLENLGEELRILYVAMTRAKEKLILTGALPGVKERLEQIPQESPSQRIPFYRLAGAAKYLDWILDAALRKDGPVRISVWDMEKEAVLEEEAAQRDVLAREILQQWDTGKTYDAELKRHLEEQFAFSYPYEEDRRLKMAFTVSELKKRAFLREEDAEVLIEEPEVFPLIPQFLQAKENLTGASRGSAYHKLLELLDFRKEYSVQTLQEFIRRMCREERLSEEMAACICVEDILEFINCPAGRRMCVAAEKSLLWREQPFVLGVDAREIYPDTGSEETILVQGIIDVYFEEEGELVVLDYKTDRIFRPEDLRKKYHAQLDYYGRALFQLTGKPVKEKILYSFFMKKEIEV